MSNIPPPNRPPKWCPQCRDEFLHSMERCPVCNVALVAELDLESRDAEWFQGIKSWAGDLDRKAAEAERLRNQWSEAEACPACGTPMAPDAAECPECGLVFVEEGEP